MAKDRFGRHIYFDPYPERGPIKMSEKKSTNPKDILSQGEQRVLLHLIPSPALIEMARAMMDGAKKYGPYNWREEGVGASTYLSAAMRHLRAWLDGEEDAADSGVHHLGHAMACMAILLDAQAVGNLVDDRPLPAPTASLMDALKQGSVDECPPDKVTSVEPDYLGKYYGETPEPTPELRDLMQPAPVRDVVTQEESEAAYRARMPVRMDHDKFSGDPLLSEFGLGAVPEDEGEVGDDLDAPGNRDPVPPDQQNPGGCC